MHRRPPGHVVQASHSAQRLQGNWAAGVSGGWRKDGGRCRESRNQNNQQGRTACCTKRSCLRGLHTRLHCKPLGLQAQGARRSAALHACAAPHAGAWLAYRGCKTMTARQASMPARSTSRCLVASCKDPNYPAACGGAIGRAAQGRRKGGAGGERDSRSATSPWALLVAATHCHSHDLTFTGRPSAPNRALQAALHSLPL